MSTSKETNDGSPLRQIFSCRCKPSLPRLPPLGRCYSIQHDSDDIYGRSDYKSFIQNTSTVKRQLEAFNIVRRRFTDISKCLSEHQVGYICFTNDSVEIEFITKGYGFQNYWNTATKKDGSYCQRPSSSRSKPDESVLRTSNCPAA